MASPSLPVLSGDPASEPKKDQLLQQALGRLSASPRPGGAEADPIVTATRRLPAVPASYAPFPEDADPRLVNALAARGIEQLYTHQAEAFGHVLAGRNVVTITPTASG
jgi:DEAD/DEAH box helicase domain-containing protein